MSDAEFDRFARSYREVHRTNIALTGEEPEYFADYKMRDFATAILAGGAPQDGQYLDFGSGVGASITPFYRHLPRARLVCADVSERSLEQSQRQNGDLSAYVLIENGRLPIQNHSIDGAFACCVFHHISHSQHGQALAELRRVLRPGAPLMVYEHNPLNPLTMRAVNSCPLDTNAVLIDGPEMTRRCAAQGFHHPRLEYRVFFPSALKRLRPIEHYLRWLPLGAQYAIHAKA
jgi:SAM-dependent methyltransferase